MRSVELYGGCGGMALGLARAGFTHAMLVDSSPRCVETLRANGFKNVVCARVEEIDFRRFAGVDLLAGGVPCQPWSVAGKDLGATDDRNGWEHALRAAAECRPKALFFECVAGLLRRKFRAYLESVIARFQALGYTIHVLKVNAVEYGVPQNRTRALIIGFQNAAHRFVPPKVVNGSSIRDALASLGAPNGVNDHVLRGHARSYAGHTGSDPDKPAKCLVAGSIDKGVGGGMNTVRQPDGTVRYFTVRELARLQTFPDTYKLPSVWSTANHQLGNAVPVQLAHVWAKAIAAALKKKVSPWEPCARRPRRFECSRPRACRHKSS